jgi:amino acid transporter
LGVPLPSSRQLHERLPKILALPVFSSDAVSSVAYGPEEVLIAIALVGSSAWDISWPIGICVAVLIAIVSMSYRQTIHAYPHGGGSYTVAKENLGIPYGLVAAASLLTDYVLTVAVSVAAGIQALVALEPAIDAHKVFVCLLAVFIIAMANLRGLRESGLLFAGPTYCFIAGLGTLVVVGLYKVAFGGPVHKIVPESVHLPVSHALGAFIILKAFSSGCSALTGIEAIANGVPAFKPPESKNAASTMVYMAIVLGTLVLGVTYLAHVFHALPGTFIKEQHLVNLPHYSVLKDQTLVAQLVDHVFGRGKFYAFIQIATCLILILAANTAFQDFPRLSSIMARDRFAPRQLANIGDRLVFTNGIIVLSLAAAGLLVLFKGETNRLIPLYAVGVFISFTLSQFGMAVRQRRLKHPHWHLHVGISTFGAIVTGVVAAVIAITKFVTGAWIVTLLIPGIVYILYKIHGHYITLGNQLRLTDDDARHHEPVRSTSIVLTSSIHKGVLPALEYARTLSHDCRALFIETDPVETAIIKERWEEFGMGVPLVIMEAEFRTLIGPIMEYLEEVKKERPNYIVTVVMPEFVAAKWWHRFLHNRSSLMLKMMLMFRRDIVFTNVRFFLEK